MVGLLGRSQTLLRCERSSISVGGRASRGAVSCVCVTDAVGLRRLLDMQTDAPERLEAIVHGRVQGVFFRHFTRQTAEELGLVGTVENQPEGTVRVIAEGERIALESFLVWLHQGPELARVDQVKESWGTASQSLHGFRILR